MSDPFSHSRLDGKVALITGAAQGIGEATARLFAARGVTGLVLTDRNDAKGRAVAADLAAKELTVEFVKADLVDGDAIAGIIAAADRKFGRIDILANVAGLTERGSVWDTTQDLWDRMFAVNVRAPFFLMQGALRIMEREAIEGAMVNVISINAHGGASFITPYSASKGALATLTKNFAHSVSNLRIKVNGLNIGWVDTPGEHATMKRYHDATDDWIDEAERTRPWGRLIKPDEVARAIAYLSSAESGLMTGSIIDFDQKVVGPNEEVGPRPPGQ